MKNWNKNKVRASVFPSWFQVKTQVFAYSRRVRFQTTMWLEERALRRRMVVCV